ncbi:MAG: phosphinothricin acetyltransferase [Chloroflexi bacterium]|nr:MAG: phosphinothricin acetyltransferase [Chloroflexota bacterium]
MENILIRNANENDAEAIARIYNHYILNTVITFEEETVSNQEIASRIKEIKSASLPYLVVEQNGEVFGFAYAGKWKSRSAYRYAVESSVYLDPGLVGEGFGSQLYVSLLDQLREMGVHTVIGGVALPNPASVRLHKKLGFTKVAEFHEQLKL